MRQIGQEPKPFFRKHIEENIQKRQSGSLFQLRANRWRLATYDKPKLLNTLRLRGPLLVSFGLIFVVGKLSLSRNLRTGPAVPHGPLDSLT